MTGTPNGSKPPGPTRPDAAPRVRRGADAFIATALTIILSMITMMIIHASTRSHADAWVGPTRGPASNLADAACHVEKLSATETSLRSI
jgi:hypothetical protein